MGAAVVASNHFEVLVPRATVTVVVLDARIRETHVPIFVRQLVLPRPPRDFFGLAIWPTVAVLLAAIALVQEPLIVALQLVVEDDAPNPTPLPTETLLSALIGAIDPRVVRQLAPPAPIMTETTFLGRLV